jgi:hypothetical protein
MSFWICLAAFIASIGAGAAFAKWLIGWQLKCRLRMCGGRIDADGHGAYWECKQCGLRKYAGKFDG